MTRNTRARGRGAGATPGDRLRLFLPGRSWRFQLVAIAAAIAAAILASQSFASATPAAASYVIQPGDTLLTIAATTGVPLDRIANLNGLKNPDVIIAGQKLQLQGGDQPTAAGASAPTGAGRYTVKSGDTLWDIARANKVSFDALLKANNVADADKLTVGQLLALPSGTADQRTAAADQRAAPADQNASAQKPSSLQQKVLAEAQRVGGANARLGVAAINLTTGERLNIRADESFPSASVMKLPILVELERQVAAGVVKWDDNLRTDAAQMIAVSDNNAANRISDKVSMVAVNDEMRRLGLGGTRFLNSFTDTRAPTNPGQNATTPGNMARLLEMIATDQVVSPPASAEMRGLLARNTDRSKLARLLPGDARIAHKSGWYDGVANDVGIVSVDRVPARWVIAVFTQNVADAETGNQLVATISKVVYDTWVK